LPIIVQRTENGKLSHQRLLPYTGNLRPAMPASPVLQMHLPELVARALDDQLAALMAKGALRLIPRHVADIDVFQARFQGDVPGLLQRAYRGGVVVLHFI